MKEFNLGSFLAAHGDEYYPMDDYIMEMFAERLEYPLDNWMENGFSDETLESFDHILSESGLELLNLEELWKTNPSLAIAYEDVKDNLLISCIAQKCAKKMMAGENYDSDHISEAKTAINYIRECQRANKLTEADFNKIANSKDDEEEKYNPVDEDYFVIKGQTRKAYGNVIAVHTKAKEEISSIKK